MLVSSRKERRAGERVGEVKIKHLMFAATLLLSALLFCLILCGPTAAAAADAPPVAAPVSGQMTPFQFIFGTVQFFLIGFFIYFWMAIRPEQLRSDERRKFVAGLKKNDEVMTTGGILGRIVAVKDDTATLDIGGNVKIRVHVDHVSQLPPAAPVPEGQRLQNQIQKASEQ